MASKTLFASSPGRLVPETDAVNEAGGAAYKLEPRHALAQLASTGCLSHTYYADAETQLGTVLGLAGAVDPLFVAKTAVFARQRGHMKDMPALLCAVLAVRDLPLLKRVFPRVIDNGKMLRNFVQIIRSGAVGRKSLGSGPKRLVEQWLAGRSPEALFRDSVGNDPSLADVIKMVHPKPADDARKALYAYLIGKEHNAGLLPALVQQFESFKAGVITEAPNVPFQMLTALPLTPEHWRAIAKAAPWQAARMNLNTFARHGCFEDAETVTAVAARLRDRESIAKARVFPYQLLAAYANAGAEVPYDCREAIQDAMEVAIENVPAIDGKVYVCPDVSGSMRSAVTGVRKGATSKVNCVDVAALVAAAILRRNPSAEVLPFEQHVVPLQLNPRDSVMTNASKLGSIGGGGTACSEPLRVLADRQAKGDLVVFVSDNESWMDAQRGRGTATAQQWERFRQINPKAKMVCIDLTPYTTTQVQERADVLNVGGFSDHVFEMLALFAADTLDAGHWVGEIEAIEV